MQGGEHRPRRVGRGEGAVVAAASGRARAPARRTARTPRRRHAPSRSPSATRARAPPRRGSLPSRVTAAHTLVGLVEAAAQVQQAGPLAGARRRRRAVLVSAPRAYSREGVVPLAALVGEVGAQLGEPVVRCRRVRRRRALRRGHPEAVSQSGCSMASSTSRARSGSPNPGAEHERVLRHRRRRSSAADRRVERLGRRRRQRPPQEGAADHRRCGRGRGGRGTGSRKIRCAVSRARWTARSPQPMSSSSSRRQLGDAGGEHEQLALGFAEIGQDVLGEVVEQHGVGLEQVLDQGGAVERATAPRRLDGEVHGERPATGGVDDVEHGRPRRRVEAESSTSSVVTASSSAPMRATSPAARRRAMRRFGWLRQATTRCSRGGRPRTSVLEEQQQRVVVADVDVVEHDDRVGGDDRVGRGAHVRRQGGDLVATVRRIGRRVGRQVASPRSASLCSAMPSTRAGRGRTASSRLPAGAPRCTGCRGGRTAQRRRLSPPGAGHDERQPVTHRQLPERCRATRQSVRHGVSSSVFQPSTALATVPAVHDNRPLVEERIDRELFERVLPLVHPRTAGDERRGGARRSTRCARSRCRRAWGPAVGDDVVPPAAATSRPSGRRDASRRSSTSGSHADSPGFQCEGLVRGPHGEPLQGVHPRRTAVPVDAGAGAGRARSSRRRRTRRSRSSGRRRSARPRRRARPRSTSSPAPTSSSSTRTPRRCSTTSHVLDGVMRTLPLDRPAPAAAAAPARARPRRRRRRCRAGRGARRARRRRWRRRPRRRPTGRSPPATPTSTRRGCGRSARPCASACARSPRRWR